MRELQNRFTKLVLEDKIFALKKWAGISVPQDRPIWLTFLDADGAYDTKETILWLILEQEGIGARDVYGDRGNM